MKGFRLVLGVVMSAMTVAAGAQTKLAATPPMGWNSWNHFAGRVNDADVRAAADAIVSTGMKDAGYIYVNVDDTWEAGRDASGVIQTNQKFPDMKALGDYIHSRGLKFGIYSSPGDQTCAKFTGSLGHEEQDAKTYAAWGVDYLKYDLCGLRTEIRKEQAKDPAHAKEIQLEMQKVAYRKMADALAKTGRPIVLSLCQYGWNDVWTWGASVGGNLWRTTGDINDSYQSMTQIGFSQAGLSKYAGPGHWNDPDMLEVGNGGMTGDEYRTHMSLWALLAAPLLAGNDLSKMSDETKAILTNRDVVAIDQDAMGKQGDRIWAVGALEIWSKPLQGGRVAVGMFNRGNDAANITLDLKMVGKAAGAKIRDVWAGSNTAAKTSSYGAMVPSHSVVLLRIE